MCAYKIYFQFSCSSKAENKTCGETKLIRGLEHLSWGSSAWRREALGWPNCGLSVPEGNLQERSRLIIYKGLE